MDSDLCAMRQRRRGALSVGTQPPAIDDDALNGSSAAFSIEFALLK